MESLRIFKTILLITLALHTTALIQSPPRIVKQPPTDELLFQVAQQQNENDKPFIIECEAEAEPSPTYRWIKNGKKFDWQAYGARISQQPGRGTLVITSPSDEDLGQYQCFASNEWGTATSNSVFVRKAELNSFKDGPAITLNAQEGDPFKLTCQSPDGWPKPNVYWLIQHTDGGIKSINNSRITLDPEGNLWFSNVTRNDESDDFAYACAATSVFRNEYKLGNRVLLNVIATGISASQNRHEPVQQYVTRKNEVVLRGKKVELYCIFGGTPLPQTVWSKDGRPIQSSDRITQGNYGNSLVIKHAQFEDEGAYTCEASNGVGEAKSYSIKLQVIAAPYFKREPEITNAVEGGTVEFFCEASGIPEPQINWIHNGLPISEAKPNPRRKVAQNKIIIEKLVKGDTGNYGCNATSSLGYTYRDVYINVLDHTRITNEPGDYEVAAGTSATFRCNAVSDSSLSLHMEWLNKGVPIDVEAAPRFVQSSDFSLTITKTTELDSGTYTCLARTELDEATAQATLTVQDVPNSPRLIDIQCNERVASLHWQPMGDNRAPILRYTIQYNTSFTPDTWEVAYESVPASEMTYTVAMSPWSNYTFRVIAWNKIGPSTASSHSHVCTTQPDVPYKNPDNVEGKGTEPNNIVIKWTSMPEIEHNAPRFMYRVYWKQDIPGEQWSTDDIPDWEKSELLIPNQPTFQQYRIKVVAINEKGEANVAPKEVIGYSGEDVPTQAPSNFTVVQVIASTSALLSWNPVQGDSLRGHLKGYKIQTWTDKEGEENLREIHVKGDATRSFVTKFVPHSKNNARVLAYNGRYNGPSSETVSFETPEGVPGTVQFFEAHQLGSSALYLIWKHPEQPNGVVDGYKIYYQTVTDLRAGPKREREPRIRNPKQTRAKLAGLEPGTRYRLVIAATTRAGEGEEYFIEHRTRANMAVTPDTPKFDWYREPSDNGYASVKVVWLPNLEGKPGSNFFVQHRQKGETLWEETSPQLYEDFEVVRGLMPGHMYEFRVVAVDGEFMSESETKEVDTSLVAEILRIH